jgi:acetoin utilization protein AcuB
MKAMPKIEKVMTAMPHSVRNDLPLKAAYEMMREHQIRHLPVQHGGKLVGILTDRDVKLASSFAGASEMKVEDVMTPEPYTVAPETPMNDVVRSMAERKIGCALIVQTNQKLVGIFTATDALTYFGDVLDQNYKSAMN